MRREPDCSVRTWARVLRVPVEQLLVQLEEAGVVVSGPDNPVSNEDKMALLMHLRAALGGKASQGCVKRKLDVNLRRASTPSKAVLHPDLLRRKQEILGAVASTICPRCNGGSGGGGQCDHCGGSGWV